MTLAEDRATEEDQLSSIRGIRDHTSLDTDDVDVNGEPTFSPRNDLTARLLYNNHLPHFTREELTRWSEILNTLAPLRGSIARTIERNRARGARRRWTKFCEFWSLLGLRIFTESLTPPQRPRRKLPKELLARIEDQELSNPPNRSATTRKAKPQKAKGSARGSRAPITPRFDPRYKEST